MSDEELKAPKGSEEISSEQEETEAGAPTAKEIATRPMRPGGGSKPKTDPSTKRRSVR